LLNNCTLVDNSAYSGGGAAALYSWRPSTLNNCTLTGNRAYEGGGVSADDNGDGACTLNNCTVTDNFANSGGGAYGGIFHNCIVYFNQGLKGANYCEGFYGILFEYSCTTPIPPGPGNITEDPQLITASHVSRSSPCVGAGSSNYSSGVDIDGEPWGSPPAMGADQPGLTGGVLIMSIQVNYTNVATDFPVSFTAFNVGPITKSVWDFGDGTFATNQPCPRHAWTTPGVYNVRLTGYNDSYPNGVSTSVVVTVNALVHYVNGASTNPVFPYATWETAATNIQDAISSFPEGTVPGALVLVADGVYRGGAIEVDGANRIVLTNFTVVRSVNGPEVTIIEGDTNGVRCAWVGDGCVLSGFTLTTGTTPGDGGGAWCTFWGVLTNCVLTGNSAGYGGGATGGTLYNCTLSGNSAFAGGGVSGGTLYNCTLTSNSVSGYGGGAAGSTLNDCTLTGNAGGSSGTFYSCTVVENQGGLNGIAFNSIVYCNSGGNYAEGTTLNYCCTTPLPTTGVGNITNEPAFMNLAAGDLRLRSDSPCIDAGTNLTGIVTTDILGLPRPMDGNNDGIARVDMGAHEFNPYRFEPVLSLGSDGFRFTVRGEPGRLVRIERSRDLVEWEYAGEVPIPASGQTLIDPAATGESKLFYRAMRVP
jgi:PKD repeat protein